MKKRLIGLLLLGSTTAINPIVLHAQDQALYFNGTNQYAEFTAPANMPKGSAARTVEFWIKSDLRMSGAKDNHEAIIELGEQAHNGSAFGIFSYPVKGKTMLAFWGHNADKALGEIPDDQWHFVAIAYSEPNIQFYLDGELKSTNSIVTAVGGKRLDTKVGKCYVGGFPGRGWYYNGAVDNLAIWNTVRSADQIKQDMVAYPSLQGNEANLVAHYKFNEGSGTVFKDASAKVSGTLKNGANWTKPIDAAPSLLSEGIWFVIQNKSDVDTDTDVLSRRLAIKANANNQALDFQQVPLRGACDEFLWKVEKKGTNQYQLINKKYGAINTSLAGVKFSSSWQIVLSDGAKHGTNAYKLTSGGKALQLSGNSLSLGAIAAVTNQVWLLQPMALVSGYHIPNSPGLINSYNNTQKRKVPTNSSPLTRQLKLNNGIILLSSNTVSEWSILNNHLIANNMMNAIDANKAMNKGLSDPARDWDKTLILLSKYDFTPPYQDYPMITNVFDAAHMKKYAGSHGYDPNRNIFVTVVNSDYDSEIPKDNLFREFDHITHEFGHAIGNGWDGDQFATPNLPNDNNSSEIFARSVSAWFNNQWSYPEDPINNRAVLKLSRLIQFNYIDKVFNTENTWMPSRVFRRSPLKQNYPTRIASGTTIDFKTSDKPVLQSDLGNCCLWINKDGNATISYFNGEGFGKNWGSWWTYQDRKIPLNPKEIRFENGQLLYIFDTGSRQVAAGPQQPITDKKTWLVVGSGIRRSSSLARLKVIDERGNILWEDNK